MGARHWCALLLTRGGKTVGPIAQHYIPPGVPGFDESGGEKGFTDLDFMQNPKGDPNLAKEYMLRAKAEGVPVTDDGRYAGDEKLLMIATNADPGLQTATVAFPSGRTAEEAIAKAKESN